MNNLDLLPSWLSIAQSTNTTLLQSLSPAYSMSSPLLPRTETIDDIEGHAEKQADPSHSALSDLFDDAAASDTNADECSDSTQSVCVIGGGPGGMFFCYHMDERMRKKEQEEQEQEQEQARESKPHSHTQADSKPRSHKRCKAFDIHCFERASSPGGVWRKANAVDTSNIGAVEMYDNLWTNGPSHNMELFDYTFDDHFKRPVSVYLSRKDVLDYIISRVTRNNPNLFDDYMHFNTEVENVVFVSSTQKFEVTTRNLVTKETTMGEFDYCVWGAGSNAKQKLPQDVVDAMRSGGFTGPILHSANTAGLESIVKGKRIVLVGGMYSAEDLALQSIKLGVEHVDVISRSLEPHVTHTESWPGNRVEVYGGLQIFKSEGNTIHLEEVEWSREHGYTGQNETEESLEGVDAVIFCTGYDPALHMMDEELLEQESERSFKVPDDWRMAENPFTEQVGHVEPSEDCVLRGNTLASEYYGLLIRNPRMMYFGDITNNPLLDHDAFAWLFAEFVTGSLEVPDEEGMRQHNLQRVLAEMDMPVLRKVMDANYEQALLDAPGVFSDHGASTEWINELCEHMVYSIRRLADVTHMGSYPLDLGMYDELHDAGLRLGVHDFLSTHHRFLDHQEANCMEDRSQWKTFRDYDNGDHFYSMLTGTKATVLPEHWLLM